MRIMLLHNYYQQAGGEEAVVRSEKAMLESGGHSVYLLSEKNDGIIGSVGKLRAALGCVYSFSSKQRVIKEMQDFRPDIVHAHNLFPVLSPSVFYACAEVGVPVIQTLHNYRMLCPAATLFRENFVCEECLGRRVAIPAIVRGCYRDSVAGTLAVVTLSAIHQSLGTYKHKVERFIALTEFSRQKFIEGGIPANKLDVKPNFVEHAHSVGDGLGKYVLFVGRLSPEKGVDLLLRAWCDGGIHIPLNIVGTGPLSLACSKASVENPAIQYLGRKSHSEVYELMGNARALVVPSACYETFGLVIAESFAKGTPVIASNLGAMQELIEHRRTGLHFDPGESDSLVAQIEWMLTHPAEWKRMRIAARAEYESKYSAEKNYALLMNIYERVLS